MKLERFASIAEIMSALAVIITLVFVVVELRDNTRAQDAATYQQISRDLQSIIASLPQDVRDKVRSGEPLSTLEYREYIAFTISALRVNESWWQQWQLGTLSDEVFEAYITHMHVALGDSVARDIWANRAIRFLPGFSAYVDAYIETNPLTE